MKSTEQKKCALLGRGAPGRPDVDRCVSLSDEPSRASQKTFSQRETKSESAAVKKQETGLNVGLQHQPDRSLDYQLQLPAGIKSSWCFGADRNAQNKHRNDVAAGEGGSVLVGLFLHVNWVLFVLPALRWRCSPAFTCA